MGNIFKDYNDYVRERDDRHTRVKKLKEEIKEICTCPSCGREWDDPEEIFECDECGEEACESCMCNSMGVSGDYCESCGEREEAKMYLEEALHYFEYPHSVEEALKVLGLE